MDPAAADRFSSALEASSRVTAEFSHGGRATDRSTEVVYSCIACGNLPALNSPCITFLSAKHYHRELWGTPPPFFFLPRTHIASLPDILDHLRLVPKLDLWRWWYSSRSQHWHENVEIVHLLEVHVALLAHDLSVVLTHQNGKRLWNIGRAWRGCF